jgi:hypoxanthine phosphoribosyltransferase
MIIEKVKKLISAEEIAIKVKEVGKQITEDYKGKDVVVVAVLKGAILFMTDLLKEIDSNLLTIDFIGLSSYEGGTKSKGIVKITADLKQSIEDKDVIIVEDIIDTGLTLSFLIKNLKLRKPKSIAICTLLEKPSNIQKPIEIDYKCFVIPDKFVIGYGLDYEERYRNLPYIGVMEFIEE